MEYFRKFIAATIKAVSFVGSDQAGKYIYERANRNGKRVQCNMGAKNHGVIMPDANKENTLNQLAGAACKLKFYLLCRFYRKLCIPIHINFLCFSRHFCHQLGQQVKGESGVST